MKEGVSSSSCDFLPSCTSKQSHQGLTEVCGDYGGSQRQNVQWPSKELQMKFVTFRNDLLSDTQR